MSTVPQVSKHVVGYGVDIQEVEQAYVQLQAFLAMPNINRVVYVYRAIPIANDGAIGTIVIPDVRYVGVYKQNAITGQDVIIYNGDIIVLYHELAHFFFAHAKTYQNSELFAQLLVFDLTLATENLIMRRQLATSK